MKICGPDFTWLPTTDWASGCIHESEFFSVGDVRQDYAQQRVPVTCQPDGTWTALTAGAED